MNTKALREIISQYVLLDPNDDFSIEKCWNEMTDMLTDDISATISFFESDCSDEEFYWLGSVFEDIAEKTQSKEFIMTLRNRLSRVSPKTYRQEDFKTEHMQKWVNYTEYVRSISSDIDFAENRIIL